ncbi:hypothetical protein MSPP1_001964 [Malassezia sp. CBS 17886]|nr:hypothetical protein MSPP1_001964 [Malassezia sp. CBS 17886]
MFKSLLGKATHDGKRTPDDVSHKAEGRKHKGHAHLAGGAHGQPINAAPVSAAMPTAGAPPRPGMSPVRGGTGAGNANGAAGFSSPSRQMGRVSVPDPSVTTFDLAGLPVHVYGLEQMTPMSPRGVPDVCISIHMHGRTGSSRKEDELVRELWHDTMVERHNLGSVRTRDFLLVTFDSRNHGERKTNPTGQKSWKEGNSKHAVDMYGMIHGTAADVTFIMRMLPAYMFPNDERRVSLFSVTGKSLGGHSAWQVLAHEPMIRVGVSFIGTPDFQRLIAMRAKMSYMQDIPPAVPNSLRALMRTVDPAMMPYREPNASNPFFGKKILACCGADDKLVRWTYSQEFLENLVVAPPNSDEQRRSLQVFVQPNVGHKVTSEMLQHGARWLAQWALPY